MDHTGSLPDRRGPLFWWDALVGLHQLAIASFRNRSTWLPNDLDLERLWQPCSIHNIQPWPIDATVILSSPLCMLVLGCLKSATSIPETNQRIGHQVDIVVSMNAEDRWHVGEPDNYAAYYNTVGVRKNLRYGGHDKQDIWGVEAAAKRSEYIARWWQVAADLHEHMNAILSERYFDGGHGPVVILIHCFGGVNRSSSTLCAILIIMYRYTAYQAIGALVSARPGLHYWARRDYFILALYELECQVRCVGSLRKPTLRGQRLGGLAA